MTRTAAPRPDDPLDADAGRRAELNLDPVVGQQHRRDDLLLHLAVERDGDLTAAVVPAQADQRVLVRELGLRGIHRALVAGMDRVDDRLEARPRELPRHAAGGGTRPNRSPIRAFASMS
jgi:hypothetical protein